MFFRVKPARGYRYLQIARSVRVEGKVRQEIIATVGRLDVLQESGQLDRLRNCCSCTCRHAFRDAIEELHDLILHVGCPRLASLILSMLSL